MEQPDAPVTRIVHDRRQRLLADPVGHGSTPFGSVEIGREHLACHGVTNGELVGERLQCTLASRDEHEIEAAAASARGQRFAYSRRCTCDQGGLSGIGEASPGPAGA